jgi:hypothetical protein
MAIGGARVDEAIGSIGAAEVRRASTRAGAASNNDRRLILTV